MIRIILAVLLSIAILISFSVPIFASLSDPDSLSIISVKVVRNTVETGDVCIIFEYDIEYSSIPTTPPASESFMFRLYDTDGTTLLSTQIPFVFINYGYGRGCGSFYFDAATAPTWSSALIINISGSPAYFNPLPTPYNYTLQTSDYSTVTTVADNQQVAASYILSVAKDIQDTYPTLVTLRGSTDQGVVLSGDGEVYFRGCIPGISSIAPTAFFTQAYIPETEDMGFTSDQGIIYSNRPSLTDIKNGFTRIGTLLGVGLDGQSIAAIFLIFICIALVIFTAAKGWGVDPGLLGASIILTAGAVLLGDAVFTIRLIMGLIAGVIVFYQVLLKRA